MGEYNSIAVKKEHNRDVYKETLQICRDGGYETASGRVDLPPMADMLKAGAFYVKPPKADAVPVVEGTVVGGTAAQAPQHGSADDGPREMVKRMKALAKKMHKRDSKPRRYTNAPYITHPAKVVDMLEGWGYRADDPEEAVSLAIAWGHDLLEDTKATAEDILEASRCKRVAEGIEQLTFRPEEFPGFDGKDEKKAAYISKIGAEAQPHVLVVKIADRLCNTLDFCEVGDVYAKEYLKLGEPLFDRIHECKYAERILVTLAEVRANVADLRDAGFPKELTAEMLKDFKTTLNGCTRPRVGTIGGHKFIAKCGSWSDYSSDGHVHNEYVADNLLRAAGLNVPFSREYRVDFGDGLGPQTIRLAVYDDALKPIMEVWNNADKTLRDKIRQQVVAAYPVQALIAGIDTFTPDNVKVDPEGSLWFVDNGASFNYRACGKKKGWYWDRMDVDDPKSGYMSLARHPAQDKLQKILGHVNDVELWAAASGFPFRSLVRQLPDSHRRHALKEYAKRLEHTAMAGRDVRKKGMTMA